LEKEERDVTEERQARGKMNKRCKEKRWGNGKGKTDFGSLRAVITRGLLEAPGLTEHEAGVSSARRGI